MLLLGPSSNVRYITLFPSLVLVEGSTICCSSFLGSVIIIRSLVVSFPDESFTVYIIFLVISFTVSPDISTFCVISPS